MFKLNIAGQNYTKIEELEYESCIENLCSSLSFKTASPFDFKLGSSVELSFNGEKLFTGYLEAKSEIVGSDERSIQIAGRSLTSVLVDSSAETKEFSKQSLKQIVESIAKNIKVSAPDLNIKKFSTEPGETIFDSIRRLIDSQGLLATTSYDTLKIFSPKKQLPVIIDENKITEINTSEDTSNLFHKITVLNNGQEDTAEDKNVDPRRTLTIISSHSTAKWEVTIRRARFKTIDITMSGAHIFNPGDCLLFKNKKCIISKINISISDGTTTTLSLKDSKAYEVNTPPKTQQKSKVQDVFG